jgi:hypothetical protein
LPLAARNEKVGGEVFESPTRTMLSLERRREPGYVSKLRVIPICLRLHRRGQHLRRDHAAPNLRRLRGREPRNGDGCCEGDRARVVEDVVDRDTRHLLVLAKCPSLIVSLADGEVAGLLRKRERATRHQLPERFRLRHQGREAHPKTIGMRIKVGLLQSKRLYPTEKKQLSERRSAEEIAKAVDQVVALVKKSKTRLRSEEIRNALNLDVREAPRILNTGVATKKLKNRGQKRATTYTSG